MKKSLSLFLALMMTVMTFSVFAAGTYTASDWAKAELTKAEEKALIPESLLNEDLTKSITRAEFAAVSVLLYEAISADKAQPVGTNPFTDTSDPYVLKAYNLGVTTGTSATAFSPNDLLTREQAAAMLTRVYKKLTINGWEIAKDSEFKLEYTAGEKFADDAEVSDWAKDSVYFMSSKSIINGVGENKFAPKNNASREQAIIIATRMTGLDITLADGVSDIDPYEEEREKPEAGNKKDTYTIGFIGGSLTEGGAAWIKETKDFLAAKMPDKEIITINAGKGGTRSNYGTARFMEDIGQYAPDMVFIEFSVNDCGQNYDDFSVHAEGILRQCLKLPKKPAVIYLHAPHPVEKDSDTYKKCELTVATKDKLATNYGVKSINVYNYMQKDYESVKEEKGYKTFTDYLATMYKASGTGFDVHGGYEKYADAIIEAFTEDYEGCTATIKDASLVNGTKRNIVDSKYTYVYANNARLNFSGPWKTYTAHKQVPTNDSSANLGVKHFAYPYFPNSGIKQVVNEQAAFGFVTKAKAIALNYISSNKGATATVYVDNEKVGTFSCKRSDHNINLVTDFVTLPGDGQDHKVIVVVDPPTTDGYVFRFGAVIERS